MKLVAESPTIHWQIVNRNLTPGATVREKLAEKIAALSKLLVHFPSDAVHLYVVLNKLPKKGLFDVRLTLRLPSNTLHAQKTGTDLLVTINTALQTLKREVTRLKAGLRRDHEWKRPARRAKLNAIKEARLAFPLPANFGLESDSKMAAAVFTALHASLLAHAERVLRMAELTGDLPLRALEPDDIVDEVASMVLDPRRECQKPATMNYRQWFYRLVQDEIDRQLRRFAEEMQLRHHSHPKVRHSDEAEVYDSPQSYDAIEEPIAAEEQSFPEERLADEKALPPDAVTAGQELVECLQQNVKNWTSSERRVFELYFLVGLEVGDVARVIGRTEEEVEHLIKQAQNRLRDFVRRSASASRTPTFRGANTSS